MAFAEHECVTWGVDPKVQEAFARDGFAVASLTDAEEAEGMRTAILGLVTRRVGFEEGMLFDAVAPDGEPGKLPQMLGPSTYAPQLRATNAFARAHELARALLGPKAELTFEHAIIKPAHDGAVTPWHQDEAFSEDPSVVRPQITVWIALSEATVANGCMRYVAGSHRGPVLRHEKPRGDSRVHFIECAEPIDAAQVVETPLRPGQCVIHSSMTLHGAAANVSPRPRVGYALVFCGPARRVEGATSYPWMDTGADAVRMRRNAWLRRGGFILEAWREARRGRLRLDRIAAFARRMTRGAAND